MKKIHQFIGSLMCWGLGKVILIAIISVISITVAIVYYELEHKNIQYELFQAIDQELKWREDKILRKYGLFKVGRPHVDPISNI